MTRVFILVGRGGRFAVLAADTVLLSFREGKLVTRLIKVDRPPYFVDTKGLPGGLIDPKETADEVARYKKVFGVGEQTALAVIV